MGKQAAYARKEETEGGPNESYYTIAAATQGALGVPRSVKLKRALPELLGFGGEPGLVPRGGYSLPRSEIGLPPEANICCAILAGGGWRKAAAAVLLASAIGYSHGDGQRGRARPDV